MSERIGSAYKTNTDAYPDFLKCIETQFHAATEGNVPLFLTNAAGLFDLFLANLPEEARRHYTCSACRKFVETYGHLVTIDETGRTTPVFWDGQNTPAFFQKSVSRLEDEVRKSEVTGVFLSSKDVWGLPITGEWHHMSVKPEKENIFTSRLLTAGQMMAEKKEDFRTLQAGLQEYPAAAVDQALTLLRSDSLYRSERCLGVAEWLKGLHTKLADEKNGSRRTNILWRSVATAPVGFCHIRSTMIGTLLDDIVAGLSFESVSRRFADKMHPLQYQRPQALPTEGNVKEAEKIIEKLGAQKSLERRFARLDELELLWQPEMHEGSDAETERNKNEGIFAHLRTKNENAVPSMEVPPVTMTWRKFSETVLPEAKKIEYLVGPGKEDYSAIVTAVHEDAPPIFQWDTPEKRNPFSWYVYIGGSEPQNWGLHAGYCEVSGVCLQPSMWYGNYPHQGKSVFFILKDAHDKQAKGSGSALFPEMLISELRAIRSTIEAYSESTDLRGNEEASACGIKLEARKNWNATIRVTTEIGACAYRLDRWD